MIPALDPMLTLIATPAVLTCATVFLAALLGGWFVTGVIVPAAPFLVLGGALAHQGLVGPLWLGLCAVSGAVMGAELGYWTGRLARQALRGRLKTSRSYRRASARVARHGARALVPGAFGSLVPVAAAMAGIPHRRFLPWAVLAAIPVAALWLGTGALLAEGFARLSPQHGRLALAALALGLLVGGLVWLVTRALRLLPFVLAMTRLALRAMAALPPVRRGIGRHPWLAGHIAARFDTGAFSGLPATLLAVLFLYLFGLWAGTVLDWVNAAPIVALDTRIATLLHGFWNPQALRIAAHVTALGDSRLVTALGAALAIWLVARGQRGLALGLVVAVAGNALSVTLLKRLFQRERPPFAYFVETSNSFPSGHAAISVAFWGTLAYVLWRLGWLRLASALVLAPLAALLIGGSRLYLGQHYLSDVVNGWLMGALWMVVAIAVAEWWRAARARAAPLGPWLRRGAEALAGVALVFAGWITVFYDKAQSLPWTGPEAVTLASPAGMVGHWRFEPMASSLMGTPLAPVNVVVQAPDLATLAGALQAAGWSPAASPELAATAQAALSAWRSLEDPTAPLIAHFWAGAPQDLAFEARDGQGQRLDLRLWRTPYRTPEGQAVFVGAVTLDSGAPDAGRERLVEGLVAQGARDLGRLATGAPLRGRSIGGNLWSSDGQAAVLRLP